ncbi:MAG TPA: EAL domain-containing protein [Alkalispirochaeta sp.]|nr:EAL domain-containing protein [Alkalispirochaeta sp.]
MAEERVLIVEDEKIIALDLQRRLEKFGYSVVALAATAEEAVEAALEYYPDIILMDIMLGGNRDGIDAAIEIHQHHNVPIVFLTAYADERTVERAKKAEPVGYVLKPFKERELQTTIDIALYKSRIDRQMREQEQLFEALLNSMNDGLIAYSKDETIRFLNPVAQDLTGWSEERAIQRDLSEIFSLYDENSELKAAVPLSQVAEGKNFEFESVYLTTEQGGRVSIAGSITPIRTHSHIDGGLITFHDVTDIKEMSEIIEYQASHDSLTGLMNREEFFTRLQEVAHVAQADQRNHSFIYLDLDQFKIVNDVCGHLAGDELLRQVSSDLRAHLEEEEHLAARLGGDEFGVLLLDASLSRGMAIARTLLRNLNRKFIWQKNAFHITASVGLVPVAGVNTDGYSILAAADDASYLAKESGGNTIKVYETADYTFLKRRGEMQWISRLNHALEGDRFVLWGQPIVSTDGHSHEHLEVLIRMLDDDDSLISPGDFIPAAEKYNLMPAVDRWVLTHAFERLDAFAAEGRYPLVSINLSGASIADESMMDNIRGLIERSAANPKQICLEITETTAIENMSRATSFIKRLKAIGVSFALDDFGNGFSSFAYLKHLPVDYLKIDGSFVRDIADDPIDYALVQAVNSIGHVMNMKTIAEYVKDDRTRTLLEKIGVDYLQGYQISRPTPLDSEYSMPQL